MMVKVIFSDFDYTLFDTSAGFGKYERRGEDGLQEAKTVIESWVADDEKAAEAEQKTEQKGGEAYGEKIFRNSFKT